jgi:hypothetical protein
MQWFPKWTQRTSANSELPAATTNVEGPWQNLIERFEKLGLEVGWAGVGGEDLEDRKRSLAAAARAELGLLEQAFNGPPIASPEAQRTVLQELMRRRALAVPEPSPRGSGAIERPWRFEWRRTAALLTIAFIVCAMLVALGYPLNWAQAALLVGCAALLALGPWRPANALGRTATLTLQAWNWLAQQRREAWLERQIERLEQEVQASDLRVAQSREWIDARFDLLIQRFELQRARAKTAANINAGRVNAFERREPYAEQVAI